MSLVIVPQRAVISLEIAGAGDHLSGQRDMVTVSPVSCHLITWDNGTCYWSHPAQAQQQQQFVATVRIKSSFWSRFCFRVLTVQCHYWRTMMELKQTDCFKLVHAAPVLFLTKEPKLQSGFFDHFRVFILVLAGTNEGLAGRAGSRGGQLRSFILRPGPPHHDMRG